MNLPKGLRLRGAGIKCEQEHGTQHLHTRIALAGGSLFTVKNRVWVGRNQFASELLHQLLANGQDASLEIIGWSTLDILCKCSHAKDQMNSQNCTAICSRVPWSLGSRFCHSASASFRMTMASDLQLIISGQQHFIRPACSAFLPSCLMSIRHVIHIIV